MYICIHIYIYIYICVSTLKETTADVHFNIEITKTLFLRALGVCRGHPGASERTRRPFPALGKQ